MPFYGGVEGVGVGVFEETVEVRVSDHGGHVADEGFDGGGVEGSARGGRALVGEGVAPRREGGVTGFGVGGVVGA